MEIFYSITCTGEKSGYILTMLYSLDIYVYSLSKIVGVFTEYKIFEMTVIRILTGNI